MVMADVSVLSSRVTEDSLVSVVPLAPLAPLDPVVLLVLLVTMVLRLVYESLPYPCTRTLAAFVFTEHLPHTHPPHLLMLKIKVHLVSHLHTDSA